MLDQLPDGAYVLSLARGVRIQEADLLVRLIVVAKGARCWMSLADIYRRKVHYGAIRESP